MAQISIDILQKFFEDNSIKVRINSLDGHIIIAVLKDDLIKTLTNLKDQFKFTILTDLFGADFPEIDQRFEVVYNLLSIELNQRLYIKVHVRENEPLPSIYKVFSAAVWYEREVFDLFGVIFENSPDLRRILTDYGFQGHPLRKDFPVTGHVEVSYDEEQERVVYKPVVLPQEFRNFDFLSPWQGTNYIIPSDEKATDK